MEEFHPGDHRTWFKIHLRPISYVWAPGRAHSCTLLYAYGCAMLFPHVSEWGGPKPGHC